MRIPAWQKSSRIWRCRSDLAPSPLAVARRQFRSSAPRRVAISCARSRIRGSLRVRHCSKALAGKQTMNTNPQHSTDRRKLTSNMHPASRSSRTSSAARCILLAAVSHIIAGIISAPRGLPGRRPTVRRGAAAARGKAPGGRVAKPGRAGYFSIRRQTSFHPGLRLCRNVYRDCEGHISRGGISSTAATIFKARSLFRRSPWESAVGDRWCSAFSCRSESALRSRNSNTPPHVTSTNS